MNTEHPQRRRIRAIEELAKGCAFDSEADGTIIKWRTPDIPQPSEADIDAKVAEYTAEWDAQEYARNRKVEYDALNQLEMQFDDKEDGTTTWEDAIKAIKTKWPKDNSGPV